MALLSMNPFRRVAIGIGVVVLAFVLALVGIPEASNLQRLGRDHVTQPRLAGGCAAPGHSSPYNCERRLEFPQCLSASLLDVQFAVGAKPAEVVRDHGGDPTDLTRVFDSPYDQGDLRAGLDRAYTLRVARGHVVASVYDYGQDSRVEDIDLAGSSAGDSLADFLGIKNDEPCMSLLSGAA